MIITLIIGKMDEPINLVRVEDNPNNPQRDSVSKIHFRRALTLMHFDTNVFY